MMKKSINSTNKDHDPKELLRHTWVKRLHSTQQHAGHAHNSEPLFCNYLPSGKCWCKDDCLNWVIQSAKFKKLILEFTLIYPAYIYLYSMNNYNSNANGGVHGHSNCQVRQAFIYDVITDDNQQIPQCVLYHIPRPQIISFTMNNRQLVSNWDASESKHAAQIHVRQQLYHPDLPLLRCPLLPAWSDEAHAMMVLWIARERRVFEMEMWEFKYLLGPRGVR
jgi:hypothetical protein